MGQVPNGKCDCATQWRSHRVSWKMGSVHMLPGGGPEGNSGRSLIKTLKAASNP